MPFSLRSIAVLLLAGFLLNGCASHRSNSRIVEGDSSTIKYTNPESAGGRIGGRE